MYCKLERWFLSRNESEVLIEALCIVNSVPPELKETPSTVLIEALCIVNYKAF